MPDFIQRLYSSEEFMPHGHCYLWTPGIVWLHVISDALIALAYYSIPITLAWFVRRRRDIDFRWIFVCFAVFILACGTTHLMEIWNVWHGNYWLSGSVKALTAAASIPTAILLTRLMPQAVALPSPKALTRSNTALKEEVEMRQKAQASLSKLNAELERRVAERTAELQSSNERLRESEAQFRTMVDAISQLAWMAQPDGFIYWYNQRWFDYTGTTPEQMEGWGWQRVHDPAVLPEVVELWKTSVASGEPFEMDFPLRAADGSFRWFLTRAFPLKDAAGRVLRWCGTNTDIGRMRDAETEIQRLNSDLERRVIERTAQLEAANKELEAFSYSVSHDLRSPLRAVDGFSQAVLEDYGPQLPEAGQGYLRTIRQGAQKMGMLIDDLLTFSRLSRAPLHRQTVNTNQLVRGVLDDLSAQRTGRQIDVRFAELPTCCGDPALLKQVWINLLSNAFKYTGKREAAVVEIGCTVTEEGDVFFVKDNGTGFDMRYAGKLFGVFQRLHRADEYDGTGVGLALVQRIIHRHGGRVWAEAEVDRGAIFFFTLEGGTH